MNPLENIKDKLKFKPELQTNKGVKVLLAPKPVIDGEKQETMKPLITAAKDDGQRANEILEKIKQKKLSLVINKMPKVVEETIVNKAPVVQEEKKKKPKKLKKIVLVEDQEQQIEELPEGGPRLEDYEKGDEKQEIVEDMVKEPEQGQEQEQEQELELTLVPKKRLTKRPRKKELPPGTDLVTKFSEVSLEQRLPRPPTYVLKTSNYYMNNREVFVNFINALFEPYKTELLNESNPISCSDIGKDTGKVSLLTHQKIVRDYINLYTPYRGLLLYHGLGSGKTCSSIAIAEGMKSARKVIIMTPASLRSNYFEEIKKCGDLLYRKNQYWEWIESDSDPNIVDSLSKALGLPRDYIIKHNGAWLVNVKKRTNYATLSSSDKKRLNDQLDEMIRNKYTFINYNGLRKDKFRQLTNDYKENIFDNSVVIIDEAHNLISRIVNKINRISKFNVQKRGPKGMFHDSLALIIYEFLLIAENCRVVLLTGTPIINYPNEIGILFNILRGYIKTWKLTLSADKSITKDSLMSIFSTEKVLDYVDYVPSSKTLTITRNPYGFENKITSSGYKGVTNEKKEKRDKNRELVRDEKGDIIYEERGTITDSDFIKRIVNLLMKNGITAVANGTDFEVHTALPDTLNEFVDLFINRDTGRLENVEKFKRRIIGLTSYFRSAQEELLPRYNRDENRHVVEIEMSDYQFKIYEDYRQEERKTEKKKSGGQGKVDSNGLFKEPSSTYRIFSRLACNFVMPSPPGRPNPMQHRQIEEEVRKDKLFEWIKENYLKEDATNDQDIKDKLTNLKSLISVEKWSNSKVQEFIKSSLNDYMNNYINQNSREPMPSYFKRHGHNWLFDKDASIPSDLTTEKSKGKAEEKRTKRDEKGEEKQRKMEAKEEEKRRKIEEKAEEKQRKKEEKEEEKRKKNEEKAEEKQRKKKGSKKAKDLDIIFEIDEDEEEEFEKQIAEPKKHVSDPFATSSDNELKGGSSNKAEEYVDDNDDVQINLENYNDKDALLRETDELESDELLEQMGSVEYKEAIKRAMMYLKKYSQEFLTPEALRTYSPKFLNMLENITDEEYKGLHLVYSQFRSMEGIGIFCLVLEANGFAKFKIKRIGDEWEINMSEEDLGKPCYALYTGTEDADEREILRNIYKGAWDYIPNNISAQLKAKSSNNNLGEIIKCLMITSAGSEGINLRNTRYVHIMEPYWHPVRIEQVIGRARRICSHQDLPQEMQTVDVFIYLMTFTKSQLDSEYAIELRLNDASKLNPKKIQTSDEKLYEIMSIKEELTGQLLKAVKESSIDCATHIKSSSKEGLVCLSFGQPNVSDFAYNPNYTQDENDTVADINKVTINWEGKVITAGPTKKKYILRVDTNQLYDYDSVMQARAMPGVNPILLGRLVNGKLVKEIS